MTTRGLPRDEASREVLRLEMLEREMSAAFHRATHEISRSIRCSRGDHGCANDGTGCICRCHDR